MALDSQAQRRSPAVVLDIGDDIGALIVHAHPALHGREIEVSPADNAAKRIHTEVLERSANGATLYAAVFAELVAGDYSLWRDVFTDEPVSIVGGAVSEVNWRAVDDFGSFRLAAPEGSARSPLPNTSTLRASLPSRYKQGEAVSAAPMGSAPLRFADDGSVAWEEIWTDFCDLAMAGGPRHRDMLLEPGSREEIEAAPAAYAHVVSEIERGFRLVTTAPIISRPLSGWVGLQCEDEGMARWLLRAIAEENVSVRREGAVVFLPASPSYQLEKEIKNVVTVVAKTNHYWQEHRDEDDLAVGSSPR